MLLLHCRYIGDGMLSCAVLGNVFASPSVDSVYRAIMACASPLGVLVIVKNYTGDRLNFGMAIEKAKTAGVNAKMIIVGDDCTVVASGSIAGRRGVAGTLFVQKIAGAMAYNPGSTLDMVYSAAENACRAVRTMGIGLSNCNLPGNEKSDRLTGPQMEVGIGIHGEPGRFIQDTPPSGLATAMATIITQALVDDHQNATGHTSLGSVAVMVNNLGASTELEMNAFVAALMPQLAQSGAVVERLYVGSFMTALDMHGVSVTLCDLAIDGAALPLLDAFVSAPAWKKSLFSAHAQLPVEILPQHGEGTEIPLADTVFPHSSYFTKVVQAACTELAAAEPLLTELDSMCGDGDCGHTVQAAARAILDKLKDITVDESATAACNNTQYANTCNYIADNASVTMGGTLGAIMELLLRAMGNHYASAILTENAADNFASALEAGMKAVMFYGGAKVGMRTMLDALHPAAAALKSGEYILFNVCEVCSTNAVSFPVSSTGDLRAAAVAATHGAESTGSIKFPPIVVCKCRHSWFCSI